MDAEGLGDVGCPLDAQQTQASAGLFTSPQEPTQGKKTHLQRQRKGPSKAEAASIIAIASESARAALHDPSHGKALTVIPPRKLSTIQHSSRTIDNDRRHRLSRNSQLKEQQASHSVGSEEARALGNDRLLQQRLQEAKALNRRDKDTTGGAVMHKFLLWQGVEKGAPLVEHGQMGSANGRSVGHGAPAESDMLAHGGVELDKTRCKQVSESRPHGTDQIVSTPERTCHLKSPPPIALENHAGPVRLAKLPTQSPPPSTLGSTYLPTSYVTPQRFGLSKEPVPASSQQHLTDSEVVSDDSMEAVDCDDEKGTQSIVTASGGRASAFRNMVGICKLRDSPGGSLAESVQTDYGPGVLPATAASSSVYSDDDFDFVGDDPDAAILSIAVDACSVISEEDYRDKEHDLSWTLDDDRFIATELRRGDVQEGHTLSPESSLVLSQSHEEFTHRKDLTVDSVDSLDLIADNPTNRVPRVPAFSPIVELPPGQPSPLRKGIDKLSAPFHVDTQLVALCTMEDTSTSLSCAPTERRSNSVPSRRERDARDQSVENIGVAHACTGEATGAHHNAHRHQQTVSHADPTSIGQRIDTDGGDLSPTLSEASGIDSDNEMRMPFNLASVVRTASPAGTTTRTTHDELDEVYTAMDFQWKKGTEVIGEGTFGQVCKGMACSTGELLAVKQICLSDGTEEEVRVLRKEIDLMQDLLHPNIVRYMILTVGCGDSMSASLP